MEKLIFSNVTVKFTHQKLKISSFTFKFNLILLMSETRKLENTINFKIQLNEYK